jgi:hypothetical protein
MRRSYLNEMAFALIAIFTMTTDIRAAGSEKIFIAGK